MTTTPGKVMRRPIGLTERKGKYAPAPAEKRPRRERTLRDPAKAAEFLAICLEPCAYAHEVTPTRHKCKRRCCGPLASSIEVGVTIEGVHCPLRRPKW